MTIQPKYDFNAPDGSTHLDLTAGEVHRQFVPWRSLQWVKRGLEAGARDVPALQAAADARNRLAVGAKLAGSRNSPHRRRELP